MDDHKWLTASVVRLLLTESVYMEELEGHVDDGNSKEYWAVYYILSFVGSFCFMLFVLRF